MKLMAIDYGDARTGVAFSDPTGSIAGETAVLTAYTMERTLEQVCALAAEKKPGRIVVGYPKNMDGSEGPRAELCAAFADRLAETTGIETVLWDERLTTVDAHRILSETGRRGKKRKAVVDAVAASLILEGYLRSLTLQ